MNSYISMSELSYIPMLAFTYDFQKSKLYRHKKFKKTDDSYLQVIKEKLLEGFRDEDDFSFMKGYEPWENLIYK